MRHRTLLIPFAILVCSLIGCGEADTEAVDTGAAADPDTSVAPDTGDDLALEDPGAPDTPMTMSEPDLPPGPFGGERPAVVHLPDDYDRDRQWPLVFLLHGFSANGFVQDMYLGVSAQVTNLGFILVIPEGTTNSSGNQFWNATERCCDFERSGVDDVAYLRGLIAEADERYAVDLDRVYFMGHSNGGFMSYRMACEAGDEIAAIMSLAGATVDDHTDCSGGAPVTVLQVHGTLDDTILYEDEGGMPGARSSAEHWVTHNNCDETPGAGDDLDLDTAEDGNETTVLEWNGCDDNSTVELWSIVGAGHIPTFGSEFTPAVLEFLLSQTRPSSE